MNVCLLYRPAAHDFSMNKRAIYITQEHIFILCKHKFSERPVSSVGRASDF